MEPSIEMHAIIKGRVQGVGFRATTRFHAVQLGLKGYAKNRADGSVEILAIGSRFELDRLLEKLKEQFSGYIQTIEVEYQKPSHSFQDFGMH